MIFQGTQLLAAGAEAQPEDACGEEMDFLLHALSINMIAPQRKSPQR
jgi:hypothetical protein